MEQMNSMMPKMGCMLLAAFGLTGILFLLPGMYGAASQYVRLRDSTTTVGTVLEAGSERRTHTHGNKKLTSKDSYALIEYVVDDGSTYECRHYYSLMEPELSKGDKVEVAYITGDPGDVIVATFLSLWPGYILVSGIGFFFLFLGLGCYKVLGSKKAPPQKMPPPV